MGERKYKSILFALLMVLWLLPLTVHLFPEANPIRLEPLGGTFLQRSPRPVFSFTSWMDGNFQRTSEKYLEEQIGFRSFFIRLRNQLDFSLFHKVNASKIIIGEKDYLFREEYIHSALGMNFHGDEKVKANVQRLKSLQEQLRKKNIDLVFVMAPGKGFFYSEYIPEEYKMNKNDKTNYDSYVKEMKAQKINLIDFNGYFLEQKKKSRYCLYPKTGIHWSLYGGALAGDSMVRYIERLRNIEVPDISFDRIEISKESRGMDNDILQALNIFSDLPNPPMAYPVIQFDSAGNKPKPDVLVIGDSFYWTIFLQSIPHHVFKASEFWYYGRQSYSLDSWNYIPVKNFNLEKKILNRDVIVIIQSESNLDEFGFGFIEKVETLF